MPSDSRRWSWLAMLSRRWIWLAILSFLMLATNVINGQSGRGQDVVDAVVNSYGTTDASINFTHVTVDPVTGRVYVGATNWIYQFQNDLQLEHSVRTGPVKDSPLCSPTDCSGVDEANIRDTKNVNKVLVVDQLSRMLIVCGSVHQGSCRRHRLEDVRMAEQLIGLPVAANDENSSTVAFVGAANYAGHQPISVLYVASTHTRQGPYRDMVPAISSRSLDNSNPRLFDIIEESFSNTARLDISSHLKDYFLVKYIYGFHSNGYVYFTTVQKKTHFRALEEWGYVSRLARICDSDAGYHTYTEITLECGAGGVNYNILQDAIVIKAGSRLADELQISRGSDILIGAFAVAKDHTNQPSTASALCVYSLADIEQRFVENIHMCYNGSVLTRDMDYIAGSVNDCPEHGGGNVGNFCHEAVKLNGSVPLYSRPLIVYPDKTLTAVTATSVGQHTVAFLGTSDGLLKKVLLTSSTLANEFEEVLVDRGRPILADLQLDRTASFVFAASPYRISKVRVKRCDPMANCTQCLNDKNPYCGWCTAESRCTTQDECPNFPVQPGTPPRWMEFDKKGLCPRVAKPNGRPAPRVEKRPEGGERINFVDIRPASLPIASAPSTVELLVQNLPQLPYGAGYLCVFGERTNPTPARITKSGLSCLTPAYGERPIIPHGQDFVTISLTIKNTVTHTPIASRDFFFYDCRTHKGCSACSSASWSCTWCLQDDSCTANVTSCGKDSFENRHPQGVVQRPEHCPRVEPSKEVRLIAQPRFGEIRPSALSISSYSSSIELNVQHLPLLPYGDSYLCFFGTKASPIRAMPSSRGLTCSTPPFSDRPKIQTGRDHIAVNLTVRSSITPEIALVQRPFLFYDCGVHKSCSACVTSSFDCNWCVLENSCTSNASSCSAREAIVGDRSAEYSLVRGVDHCPHSKHAEEILVTDTTGAEVALDGIYRNWVIGLISAAGALFLVLSLIMLIMSRLNARGFLRGHHPGARVPLGTHLRRQHGWLTDGPAEVPVQSWNYFGRSHDPQFERTTLKPVHGNQRPVLSLTEDVGRYTLVRLQPPLVDVRNESESRIDHWKTLDADTPRIKY